MPIEHTFGHLKPCFTCELEILPNRYTPHMHMQAFDIRWFLSSHVAWIPARPLGFLLSPVPCTLKCFRLALSCLNLRFFFLLVSVSWVDSAWHLAAWGLVGPCVFPCLCSLSWLSLALAYHISRLHHGIQSSVGGHASSPRIPGLYSVYKPNILYTMNVLGYYRVQVIQCIKIVDDPDVK